MRIPVFCLLLTGALLVQAAPGSALAPTAAPAGTVVVKQWQGYNGPTDFATEIAQTHLEWEGLWASVRRPPPQKLNVATEMGVLIRLGERQTGGYAVRVINAYVEDKSFVIEFGEYVPGPAANVVARLTQPWVIAIVPRSELPVIFKKAFTRPH